MPDRVSESLIPDHGDMGAVLQKRHGKEIFLSRISPMHVPILVEINIMS